MYVELLDNKSPRRQCCIFSILLAAPARFMGAPTHSQVSRLSTFGTAFSRCMLSPGSVTYSLLFPNAAHPPLGCWGHPNLPAPQGVTQSGRDKDVIPISVCGSTAMLSPSYRTCTHANCLSGCFILCLQICSLSPPFFVFAFWDSSIASVICLMLS